MTAIAIDPTRLATITAETYIAMVESGALIDRRVELIAGKLVDMSPISNPHAAGVNILADIFRDGRSARVEIRTEQHVDLSPLNSMPEPDLAVCSWRADRYGVTAPGVADIHLIVEVALSSLPYDRTTKRELYELAGIPEYWIVNLRDRQIEQFVPDAEGKYPKDGEVFAEGTRFSHALMGEIVVAEVLPMTGEASA